MSCKHIHVDRQGKCMFCGKDVPVVAHPPAWWNQRDSSSSHIESLPPSTKAPPLYKVCRGPAKRKIDLLIEFPHDKCEHRYTCTNSPFYGKEIGIFHDVTASKNIENRIHEEQLIHTIHLIRGWNLISFPLKVGKKMISEAFKKVSDNLISIWTYEAVWGWRFLYPIM